jgi:hypothetical protein
LVSLMVVDQVFGVSLAKLWELRPSAPQIVHDCVADLLVGSVRHLTHHDTTDRVPLLPLLSLFEELLHFVTFSWCRHDTTDHAPLLPLLSLFEELLLFLSLVLWCHHNTTDRAPLLPSLSLFEELVHFPVVPPRHDPLWDHAPHPPCHHCSRGLEFLLLPFDLCDFTLDFSTRAVQ